MKSVLDRFITYVKIDTESAYNQSAIPSTKKQFNLANLLVEELKSLGASETSISESCCVYAKVPGNVKDLAVPSIGFSAHLDTTPEFCGGNVKPQITKNYNGKDITLNKELGIVTETAKFPHLSSYIGCDIVTSDGTTLLGADDKAGIAEIMTMLQYFHKNKEEKHGELQLFFPSDEEIGNLGAKTLDKKLFSPDFAYTLDGGGIGEITWETFNAASAHVVIKGVNIHPGLAKGQMKNASLILTDFINMLPQAEAPSHTTGYEGYYHVLEMNGTVELATMDLYIRDHDRQKFALRKQRIVDIANFLNTVYGVGTVNATISDTYRNIRDALENQQEIVKVIETAMLENDVKPHYIPMRGGTDGAILSFEGIPCPNICTGGHNFHSKYEYVPVQSLEKISKILISIVKSFVK